MKGVSPKLLLFWAVLPPAVLTGSWAVRNLPVLTSMGPAAGIVGAISSILAQNGLALLVILVFLGSRNIILEKSMGLGRVLRVHKALAVITLGLLVGHVILQFWRFNLMGGSGLVRMALLTAGLWEMVVGWLALLLLIAAAVPAVLGVAFRLPFRVWKPFHFLAYGAVPLGMVHAAFRGSSMGESPQIQVLLLLAGFLVLAVIMRVFRSFGLKRFRA